jgi:phage tail-like protein
VRAAVDFLATTHPLAEALPSLFQEDDFTCRLMAAFDEVLAPVVSSLDCLDAYLDPSLAPPDFLEWLAGWVGMALDANWPEDRRRYLVRQASELYRLRGTARGLAEQVAVYTGSLPEVVEGGGVRWSSAPGGPLPGTGEQRIVVRVRPGEAGGSDPARLDAIVAAAKPAHLEHVVEVVGS